MALSLPVAVVADPCAKNRGEYCKAGADRSEGPFAFLFTAAVFVRDRCERLGVRDKLDALSAKIESDNKAHTSLVDSYVSATIKVPGKPPADKNGIGLSAEFATRHAAMQKS